MRVSSGMIFDTGLGSIQRQTSSLLNTQQQVASGRRILTPADDPVAAARALDVSQSQAINQQYGENQKNATEILGLQDNRLTSVGNLLQRVRELAVQAGGGGLSTQDRRSIGTELRGIYGEMLGLANATDGTGQYQFSGYQGATQPFSGSVETGVVYAGDDGQRLLQVSPSRQLAVSDSGNDVFMRIRNGNGYFTTAAAAANTGSGVIGPGQVVDPAAPLTEDYTLSFTTVGTTLNYNVTGSVSGAITSGVFSSGQAISFGNVSVVVNGTPSAGDQFALTRASSQSLFATLGNLIQAVEAPPSGSGASALLANRIGAALTDLTQAQDNVLKVRASLGARMNEIDQLGSAGEDLDLQYAATLSRLQDVDYAAAITRLTREQTYLDAAQKSFAKISGLSLFNYV